MSNTINTIKFKQGNQDFLSTNLTVLRILNMLDKESLDKVKEIKNTKKASFIDKNYFNINANTIVIAINSDFIEKHRVDINESITQINNANQLINCKLLNGYNTLAEEIKSNNLDRSLNVLLVIDDNDLKSNINISGIKLQLHDNSRLDYINGSDITQNYELYYKKCLETSSSAYKTRLPIIYENTRETSVIQ